MGDTWQCLAGWLSRRRDWGDGQNGARTTGVSLDTQKSRGDGYEGEVGFGLGMVFGGCDCRVLVAVAVA